MIGLTRTAGENDLYRRYTNDSRQRGAVMMAVMADLSFFSLEGKTALVAGASRGIGLAIAQHLARAGARTLLAARSADKLEANADSLRKEGHTAQALSLDITSSDSIADLAERAADVDIFVAVAGTNLRKRFETYTVEEYERMMNTNLHGVVFLTQKVGARMVQRGKGGKIIFIGSLMSVLGLPYLTVYAMTKSALAGLTHTLAAEWGRYNIQVNCIAPGFIVTDLNREMWQAAGNEAVAQRRAGDAAHRDNR